MIKSKKLGSQKQVVYILGAGATQAEASYHGGEPVNLLMRDSEALGLPGVSNRVVDKTRLRKTLDIHENADIEKLISLLAATGVEKNIKYAEKLRRTYYEDILEHLDKAGILYSPQLATGLLEMHKNKEFVKHETLLGVISLNHDNLTQVASQEVYHAVNLGFNFSSTDFVYKDNTPLIIQLHGAFNWRKTLPLDVVKLDPQDDYNEDMLWIPPTILKESKDYPFNKLMGLSYELLKNCQVLRIVGCSLSQNDWNLISVIFNAQHSQYLNSRNCFKIELLMDEANGQRVVLDYAYLKNLKPISQIEDGDFSDYSLPLDQQQENSALSNPFEYWIKTKVNHHLSNQEFDATNLNQALKQIIEA